MKFGGIGIPELVIILIVVLLIFGPKNLPKLGSALGKTVKNLRDGMGSREELDEAVDELDEDGNPIEEGEEVVDEPVEDVVEEEAEPAKKPVKKAASDAKTVKKKVVKKVVEETEE